MKPGKALKELDTDCAWGCKKNSQGNVSYWKGYREPSSRNSISMSLIWASL